MKIQKKSRNYLYWYESDCLQRSDETKCYEKGIGGFNSRCYVSDILFRLYVSYVFKGIF